VWKVFNVPTVEEEVRKEQRMVSKRFSNEEEGVESKRSAFSFLPFSSLSSSWRQRKKHSPMTSFFLTCSSIREMVGESGGGGKGEGKGEGRESE